MDSCDCDTCKYNDHTDSQPPCSKCKGGERWEPKREDD